MSDWVEPTTDWQPVASDSVIARWLGNATEPFDTWPPAPFERTPTYCYRAGGDEFWIWQPEVGAARFSAAVPHVTLHALSGTDPDFFTLIVWRSWLPAIYPIWGRQVLHASAVAATASGRVIAFTGPTGAGKSTTAYGLSRRAGWRLAADDTLVFSCASTIELHPLRRHARLRQPTAAHFGKPGATEEAFDWPAGHLRLGAVYVLDGHEGAGEPRIVALPASEGYPLLLGQAHAMTLKLAEHNQRLMRDYLTLAATAPVFRLSHSKSFESFDAMLDAVEAHSLA